MSSHDIAEVEWQFDVLDLEPVRRWLTDSGADGGEYSVAAAGTHVQSDTYLDTEDQRFSRAGFALRVRRLGRRRGAEATLKAIDSTPTKVSGLRSRREVSEQLDDADPALVARAGGPVGQRVRAVAGRKPLLPLFEVRTRREVLKLQTTGSAGGEIALDETAIRPANGSPAARFQRVEIEIPESALAGIEAFVTELRAHCALQPAGLSKYEAGLLSAGITRPAPERFGPTEVGPGVTIREVALAVLRRQFSAMLAKEPGTRLGDDIEELHDMRVASRRLRAALALFEAVLPETILGLKDELAWIGGQLGAVRDLDVQLEQLESWIDAAAPEDRDPLRALRSVLEAQRADARGEMLEALESRRYDSLVRRFGRTLRARHATRSGAASLPALAVAPDLIDARWTSVRKASKHLGRSATAADYHRLRIRCKRFRYALEFLTDVYAGRARPVLKRLVALQDLLGLHQDAVVAIERLRALTAQRGSELGPETIFAMGEIAERYRQSVVELRKQVPPAYEGVSGKRWISFRESIEAQRPAPEVPVATAPTSSI
ncbi:MAG TPA: CHAD domain-containing protein [Gaiellaceae bacterium]